MEAGIIRFSEFQFYKLKSGKYLYKTLYFIMENHHYYITAFLGLKYYVYSQISKISLGPSCLD